MSQSLLRMTWYSFIAVVLVIIKDGNANVSFNVIGNRRLGEPIRPVVFQNLPQNGVHPHYVHFPHTFPGINLHQMSNQPQIDHMTSNMKPLQDPFLNSIPPRPTDVKPNQMDHHFLTRPQSNIMTPTGNRYMPHVVDPRPLPIDLETQRPFYPHHPFFASPKPGITIMAKNIFVHNDIHETNSDKEFGLFSSRPFSYLLKPTDLGSKTSLLDFLVASNYFGELNAANKGELTKFAANRPLAILPFLFSKYQHLGQLPMPSNQSPAMNTPIQMPINENKQPTSFQKLPALSILPEHKVTITKPMSVQKDITEQVGFHPLLSPTEEKFDGEVTEEKAAKDKSETETAVVAVSGNLAVETTLKEATADIIDETED